MADNNILNNHDTYRFWRDKKLANTRTSLALIEIKTPSNLTPSEKSKIKQECKNNNFALFNLTKSNHYEQAIINFNTQFGLTEKDNHFLLKSKLTYITPNTQPNQKEFIPYTTKKLNWHTDGYYNTQQHRIRSFSLFCVNPAITGGANHWIDNDILYILLREKNPKLTQLLTQENAMTIPAHKVNGKIRRVESKAPIFLIDNKTNTLYLRYTQRKKNITFHPEILEAVALLDEFLTTKTKYHFKYLLQTGQGIICNNIIHTRESFNNDENNPRLLLRGRYFAKIS